MFFTELYASETRKLVERLINYVIYKVSIFLFRYFMKCVTVNFILIIYWQWMLLKYMFV